MTRTAVPNAARVLQAPSSSAGPFLQRKCACGAVSAAPGGHCEACEARRALPLQPKLAVSSPGDRFEREADRIADEVTRTTRPGPEVQPALTVTPLVQREAVDADEEDEEDTEGEVQTKRAGPAGAPPARPVTESDLRSLGAGRSLPPPVRAFFEPRLGHDISRVRIHTDTAAHDTARRIDARAFTHREHIYFASGQYAPGSMEGRRLIAHELAHTLQQRPGIARSVQPAAVAPATPPPVICGPSNCACDEGATDELKETRVKAMEVIGVATQELAGLDFSARVGRRARARRRFKRVFGRSFGVKTFTAANATVVEQRLTAAKGFLAGLKVNKDLLCDGGGITLACQSQSPLAYYNPAPPRIVFCTAGDIKKGIAEGIAKARLKPGLRALQEVEKRAAESSREESVTEMYEKLEKFNTDQSSTEGPTAAPPSQGGAPRADAEGADALAYELAPSASGPRTLGEYEEAFLKMKLIAKADLTATMIHEAIHHKIQPGIVDIYSTHSLFKAIGGRGATAKELGPAALENPDSYARFALDLVQGKHARDPATGKEEEEEILPEAEEVLATMDKASEQTTEIGPAVARRKIRLAVELAKQAMRETEVGLRLAQSGGFPNRKEAVELLRLLRKSGAVGPGTPSDQALQDLETAIGALVSQFDVKTKTTSVRRRQADQPDPNEIELLVSSGIKFRKENRLDQVRLLLKQVLAGNKLVAGLTGVVIDFSKLYGVLKGFAKVTRAPRRSA